MPYLLRYLSTLPLLKNEIELPEYHLAADPATGDAMAIMTIWGFPQDLVADEETTLRVARLFEEQVKTRLFGASATAPSPEPDPLNSLEQAMAEIEALDPFPRAIWFVDDQESYARLCEALPTITAEHPTLEALPLKVWNSQEQEGVWFGPGSPPWFVCIPGIWVEMSNGHHYPLKLDP